MNNPNRKNISAVLNALTEDDSNKKKSAVFRVHYEDIENALKSGVPRSQIVQALNENGLEISIAMFSEYLYRERKKRLKEKTSLPAEKKETISVPFMEKEKSAISNLFTEKSKPETEPVKEWKSAYSKNDPRMIDEILRNSTDIDALAKEYRELKKKGKQ